MEQELDYAQMLEIPISTVSVVRKKSFFKRKLKGAEDLKDKVVESVNKRVGENLALDEGESVQEEISEIPSQGNFTQTLDLTKQDIPEKKKRDKLGLILIAETVAACLIAGGIFLTNIFMPNSAINTFFNGLTATEAKEAAYTDFALSSPVSTLSDTQVTVTDDGVLCFTDCTSIYPVCQGTITSITENDGLYTVEISHTSKFTSCFTGLDSVYYEVGDTLYANLPFAYSSGKNEVRCSMYDGGTLLNCYSLSGAVPVWNS